MKRMLEKQLHPKPDTHLLGNAKIGIEESKQIVVLGNSRSPVELVTKTSDS